MNSEENDALENLPRPTSPNLKFQETDDSILLTARPKSAGGCFLIFWLCGWTFGCVFLLGMVINKPSLMAILFAIPFWAAWLAVASLLCWSWFGRETVLLQRDRVVFMRKAIFVLNTRNVPIEDVRGVRVAKSSYQENDQYLYGLEVQTTGKPIRFGFRLSTDEREWLVQKLRSFLRDNGMPESSREKAEPQSQIPVTRLSSTSVGEPLRFEKGGVDRPHESSWKLQERVEGPEFSRRGSLSIAGTLVLLFFNCFWNGVVGVFVCVLWGLGPEGAQPTGGEWWFVFLFLIPFEVIGLGMLAALVLALVEPFTVTSWRIRHSELLSERRWPFFSKKSRREIDEISQLELHVASDEQDSVNQNPSKWSGGLTAFSQQPSSGFRLVFRGHNGTEACVLTDATEGEALWIADVFMRHVRDWRA